MSANGQLESVGLIDSNLSRAIFFDNETHIGFDPKTNEPIYWGSRKRAKIGPKIDPQTGTQEWRKHATTGTPLVKVNEVKGIYDEEFIYKKISDGHGQVYRETCEHPDVLQRRHREVAANADAEARGRALLRELGASGMTAAEIREAVAARHGAPAPAQVPGPSPQPKPGGAVRGQPGQPAAMVDDYPFEYEPGLFYLSDQHKAAVEAGDTSGFEGSAEEAIDAVIALTADRDEVRNTLEQSPSY